ncbi:uncharacterized protein CLUP02_13946 [Colletotrichum lupini]|uniref:Uncharacterized protein n=1 Tax=Colletotrichum lupini TaxID=145971 RepID=A0A9Q8T3G0_9PEZI|nr:uncharacterized protein CLUP02_13946 [Colletotrichum lupini]UQC88422.1 hypothetical protein CLUP02_13946 [Colletotrichum lupini]
MCVSWLNFSNSLSIFPLHTPHHVEAFQKTNLIARAQQVKTRQRRCLGTSYAYAVYATQPPSLATTSQSD